MVALIVAYTLVGAGIFGSLEADSQMEQSREAARIRARMAKVRWLGVTLPNFFATLLYTYIITYADTHRMPGMRFEFSAHPSEGLVEN